MSHYRNVSTIIKMAEKYDSVALITLIEETDAELLADDIVYIVTTLFATMHPAEVIRLKAKFMNDIVDYEVQEMDFDEDQQPE